MGKSVIIKRGPKGWGGPLVVTADEKRHYVSSITNGGIDPVAQKLADMLECDVVDGFNTGVPNDEIAVAVVNCGGTARCGTYPKLGIPTVNLTPVGQSGPLAKYIVPEIYVSGCSVDDIEYADGTAAPIAAPAPKAEEPKKEAAPADNGKKENFLVRFGRTIGRLSGDFYGAGKDTIEMVIKNVLPFMAFISVIVGIVNGTGVGDWLARTVSPIVGTLPGMVILALFCGLPFISPLIGPGAVIAQIIGVLVGQQIGAGGIKAQYALPALFAIDAQVGCDFIPVGLSLGEAEPDTVTDGVPAVLFERTVTGPISVLIAYVFSIGLYT